MLVLEYMVRSTGKLHHHKMKLLRLNADSSKDEMYDYLLSRHALYIDPKKVAKKQITNLIERLQMRIAKGGKENKA